MLSVESFLEETVAFLTRSLRREADPDQRRIVRRLLRQQERQLADFRRRPRGAASPARAPATVAVFGRPYGMEGRQGCR